MNETEWAYTIANYLVKGADFENRRAVLIGADFDAVFETLKKMGWKHD